MLLAMIEMVLVLGQPTSNPKNIILAETVIMGISEISVSSHSTPHVII